MKEPTPKVSKTNAGNQTSSNARSDQNFFNATSSFLGEASFFEKTPSAPFFKSSQPSLPIQRQGAEEEAMTEEALIQQKADASPKANKTGLPDTLKTGMENLSGMSLDDVKVHRNSAKPADLQAHAYAQGTDIYLGPGQEQHLPHEAWHVVQQKQGRVKPTMQLPKLSGGPGLSGKGKVNVNDDAGLEREADVMGGKSLEKGSDLNSHMSRHLTKQEKGSSGKRLVHTQLVSRADSQVISRKIDANALAIEIKQGGEELPSVINNVYTTLQAYNQSPGDIQLATLIRATNTAKEKALPQYNGILMKITKAYAEDIALRMVRNTSKWPSFDAPKIEISVETKKIASKGKDAIDAAASYIKAGRLRQAQNSLMEYLEGDYLNTKEELKAGYYKYMEDESAAINATKWFSSQKDPRYMPREWIKVYPMLAEEKHWVLVEALQTSIVSEEKAAYKNATYAVMTTMEEVMHFVQEYMGIWHSPETGQFLPEANRDPDDGITDFDEVDIIAWIIDQNFPAWAIEKWGKESEYAMRSRFMKWKGM